MWDVFFEDLLANQVGGTPRPSASEALEAFEKEAGISLPMSYKLFATTIGPVRLCDHLNLVAPCAIKAYDLLEANVKRHQPEWEEAILDRFGDWSGFVSTEDTALTKSLIFFAFTTTGEQLCWCPLMTSREGDEFPIFAFCQDVAFPLFIAASFPALIDQVIRGRRFSINGGGYGERLAVTARFVE